MEDLQECRPIELLQVNLPSAYCDIWKLHNDFRQKALLECSIYKLVHRNIRLD